MHYGRNLLLQFVDEEAWVILLVFDVAQFLFPNTCQLAALEQFFLDHVYQFDASRCGH